MALYTLEKVFPESAESLLNCIAPSMEKENDNDKKKKAVESNGSNRRSVATESIRILDLVKYIPLRLSPEERALLTVLENTLHVSEYTDHVDVSSNRRGQKARRILDGILEVCHIATGLAVSSGQDALLKSCFNESMEETAGETAETTANARKQKKKKNKYGRRRSKPQGTSIPLTNGSNVASRSPRDNALLFQKMCEIGRRNKVLNPSSMRTTYGKLMYMMQDSQSPSVARSLGFSLHKDLVLVGPYLHQHDCADLVHDKRLVEATQFICDRDRITGEKLDRQQIQAKVQRKRAIMDQLVQEYAQKSKLSSDDVKRAIESISDAVAYIESNVAPVQTMLHFLEDNFDSHKPRGEFSLQLRGSFSSSSGYSRYGLSAFSSSGSSGPTLSHSHSTQYTFVWQSLRLWCKVQRNMHKLWVCADDDLLSTSTAYHLYNTGQGLNRVQACPKVAKVMRNLLHATQQEAGSSWVGLSVIHLGDRDVPNALIFIDKYTQIPRFLNPIVHFLQGLPELCDDPIMKRYVEKVYGSVETLKMTVLCDYFKHGFDGSGDDGGSCIDGRLTSSWNWTSRIAKKSYYHAFMLSGFQGFDGDFK